MASLIEEAKAYEPQRTLNIADLPSVSVDLDLKDEKEVEYPYRYIEVDGKKYRVPTSVVSQLKVLVEENPRLTKVKVKKVGEGMNTEYVVIPM